MRKSLMSGASSRILLSAAEPPLSKIESPSLRPHAQSSSESRSQRWNDSEFAGMMAVSHIHFEVAQDSNTKNTKTKIETDSLSQ